MPDTTLRISKELHTTLKVEAVKQQRTLLDVTEEAIREWLARQGQGND